MKPRPIHKALPAQETDMDGFKVFQPLPYFGLESHDPFLLIHHIDEVSPGDRRPQELGVGPHGHRGFSPVTFVFQGDVHHRDSHGGDAVVKAGGTQWMFAGRGITHSERPSKELAADGGPVEFIQFWVNAPAKSKMEQPFYQPISEEQTPKVELNGGTLGVVAGEYDGVKGPVPTYSPLLLLRGVAKAGAQLQIEVPSHFNCLLYLLKGSIQVSEKQLTNKYLTVYKNEGEFLDLQVKENSTFIVLAGEPINEKIVKYGPYVMNNETEILEAMRDEKMGKMGILIEEF